MIHDKGEIDENVTYGIKAGWLKWRNASGVLYDRRILTKLEDSMGQL